MTSTLAPSYHSMISPFLLPYIEADELEREEREKSSDAQHRHSMAETEMLSPYETRSEMISPERERLHRTSYVSWDDTVRTPSPKNAAGGDSESSTDPRARSVIAQSVHELLFDPELTFINSPVGSSVPSSSSPHNFSSDSPVRMASPNRSAVPLDESEIGFSNELRVSLELSHQPVEGVVSEPLYPSLAVLTENTRHTENAPLIQNAPVEQSSSTGRSKRHRFVVEENLQVSESPNPLPPRRVKISASTVTVSPSVSRKPRKPKAEKLESNLSPVREEEVVVAKPKTRRAPRVVEEEPPANLIPQDPGVVSSSVSSVPAKKRGRPSRKVIAKDILDPLPEPMPAPTPARRGRPKKVVEIPSSPRKIISKSSPKKTIAKAKSSTSPPKKAKPVSPRKPSARVRQMFASKVVK